MFLPPLSSTSCHYLLIPTRPDYVADSFSTPVRFYRLLHLSQHPSSTLVSISVHRALQTCKVVIFMIYFHPHVSYPLYIPHDPLHRLLHIVSVSCPPLPKLIFCSFPPPNTRCFRKRRLHVVCASLSFHVSKECNVSHFNNVLKIVLKHYSSRVRYVSPFLFRTRRYFSLEFWK